MKLIPTLALLLLTALPTYARLGETKAECEKRYGKPSSIHDGSHIYFKNGIQITIEFLKEKAAYINYFKIEAGVDLTEAERETLLKANAGTSTWPASSPVGNDLRWLRADKQATALYFTRNKNLCITTPEYDKHLSGEGEETPKLDGF